MFSGTLRSEYNLGGCNTYWGGLRSDAQHHKWKYT
uniref:Uncharacterized protein n=1 Tax=Rhizophora mucronata TaxID=61149 RepID=A0A2P2P6J9_RHIMU